MLSRRTEWMDQGEELFTGVGQRLLVTDVDEYPLMDVRSIELDTEAPASEAAADDVAAGAGPAQQPASDDAV